MTEYKTWRVGESGALLGTMDIIISPWTGGPTEAVVNIDSGEIIAAHGASCVPFQIILPGSAAGEIFKGSLREATPSIAPSLGTTEDYSWKGRRSWLDRRPPRIRELLDCVIELT